MVTEMEVMMGLSNMDFTSPRPAWPRPPLHAQSGDQPRVSSVASFSRLFSQLLGGWWIDYIGPLLTVNLLNVAGHLSLPAFKTLFLSLGFNTLTVMSLGVDLFKLSFWGVVELLECVHSCLSSDLGSFQPLFPQINFLSLSLSSIWDVDPIMHLWMFDDIPRVL